MVGWTIIFVCIIVGGCVFLYARYIEPNRLVIKDIHLQGEVTKEVTILHFTDTHVKFDYTVEKIQELIDVINAHHPDIIIFSGDLMDNYDSARHLREELVPLLRAMHATYGKFAVYGNHDIGGGARSVYADMMRESGFILLQNDQRSLPELQICILGLDDATAGFEDISITKQKQQPYQILITHEPDIVNTMELSTIDLIMSGHTHGGQVAFPFIRKKVMPRGGKMYRKGLYTIGKTTLYVSVGIGTTKLPFRLGNPPELVVYTIHPNK